MAALIISISSEESVGSHAPRVILFDVIPTIIPVIPEVPIVPTDPIVAPEVGAVLVVLPTGVLDLVDYSSSSDFDLSEDSLPPIPDLPLVSPFLCSDDSEADGESKHVEQRPVSSSYDTLAPLSEFPLAPVVAPPRIRRRPAILVRPVGPILARRLARRRVSHHSSDRHSSLDSSSSSLPSDHSLFEHAPPDTTDADTSTPQRFAIGKRCRSPTASVPSPTHVLRLIAPTPADLLPPRKMFRDSYSPEDSGEEHMEVDTADAEAVMDVGISEGVVAYPEDGVGIGFEIAASDVTEDEEFEAEASTADTREVAVDPLAIGDSYESSRGGIPDFEDTIYDIVHYMSKVHIDRITEIETTQRQLETSLIFRRDRDDTRRRLRRLESTMTITRSGMTLEAIEELINRCVEEALAAYEATRVANVLEAENQSQNDSDNGNGNGGNGNGKNGNSGNGNPNENGRGDRPVARECTYQDFMKFQPLNFKGTEGVVGLIRAVAAFAMSWRELMKLMTEVYCPRNEDFKDGILCCGIDMVPEEEDQVEKFIGGLPDNIQGNVIAAEPTKLQDVVRIANNLMDQTLKGFAVKNAENIRRLEVNLRDNRGQLTFKCKCQRALHCEMWEVQQGWAFGPRQGYYRSDYPKMKDQNRGNKAGNKNGVGEVRGKAYVLGGGEVI
ncbi:hypothetical protein Tco_0259837 [Tanacetum coccineum]